MTESRDRLMALYRDLGFVCNAGERLRLQACCANAERCWMGVAKDHMPDENVISPPWEGQDYRSLGLLVVGINTNNGNFDEDALPWLVQRATEELAHRRRVSFGDPDYGGTIFYHRVGACAFELAASAGLIAQEGERCPDGFPSNIDVSRAYRFLAYTNHVKCTLVGSSGAPTGRMWDICGSHVLRKEIDILRPRYVLVLGALNVRYFYERVVGRRLPTSLVQEIGLETVDIGSTTTTVLFVPHPSRGRLNGPAFSTFRGLVRGLFAAQ